MREEESEVPNLGEGMDKGPEAGGSYWRNSVCLESSVKRRSWRGPQRPDIQTFVGQIKSFRLSSMGNRDKRIIATEKG